MYSESQKIFLITLVAVIALGSVYLLKDKKAKKPLVPPPGPPVNPNPPITPPVNPSPSGPSGPPIPVNPPASGPVNPNTPTHHVEPASESPVKTESMLYGEHFSTSTGELLAPMPIQFKLL